MKKDTELGSRIAEVHNGSSIFTGGAGSGESNARRYLIENDLVEAIIALPENMFYNTGIGTFIWILSNKKEERRKGKVQLIDATALKSPLKKNMGKSCINSHCREISLVPTETALSASEAVSFAQREAAVIFQKASIRILTPRSKRLKPK